MKNNALYLLILATFFCIFNNAYQIKPDAAKIWLEQLAAVTPVQIAEIFDRIPENRITPAAARFAIDLLEYNRQELLALSEQYLAESTREYEQQVQSNLVKLKAEVVESSGNPNLTFSVDTLSLMEKFLRDRLEKSGYSNPQDVVDSLMSEFDLELQQRLFQRVEDDILELESSDNLSMLEVEIRQELLTEGLSRQQADENSVGAITILEDEEEDEGEDIGLYM